MHNEEFHICGNLKIDFLGLRHFQQYRGSDALPGLNRIHRCKADKCGRFSIPLDFLPLSLIWERLIGIVTGWKHSFPKYKE